MFLIGMKEPAMHCRARRLRETLKIQSRAVTVLASHMRTFLQKKRFVEMKRRQYAATKIQAVFRYTLASNPGPLFSKILHIICTKLQSEHRQDKGLTYHHRCVFLPIIIIYYRGYQQRVLYKVKQAEALEREKKQKQIEDFAQLVQRHKDALEPFPRKGPGLLIEVSKKKWVYYPVLFREESS